MYKKKCETCGKYCVKRHFESTRRYAARRFCSRECVSLDRNMSDQIRLKISQSKKGTVPWNKGKKGVQVAWNKGNAGFMTGEKNGMWKGGVSNRLLQQEKLAGRTRPDRCEVCYQKTKLDFDHCHRDNIFRGWICRRCNLVLGMVKDNRTLLRNLALYLDTSYDETRPRSVLDGLLSRDYGNN